eukprot:CAMPEP_0169263230 /NCGR_PEP_ID=MMETSP1016-20121227/44267_1 /TAXON_ID=342587 /ORGANISM="Karlodinium micrum, Strain CCMP2283" /LENGTH=92 /DNA_ID=CAMNT_0009346083 /DNA_START=107 /DNA_END=381 /DNA_ORIENTATION=+
MAMNCVFALVFAAVVVGVLNELGVLVRSRDPCPCLESGEYSNCEMWEDTRAVLSFVLGALVCCLFQSSRSCDCPVRSVEQSEDSIARRRKLR